MGKCRDGGAEVSASRRALLATCSVLVFGALGPSGNAAPVTDPVLPFTNAGVITGILITHTPNPQGNVVNAGTIAASSNPTAAGIQISGAATTLAGVIINSGTIQASANPLGIFQPSTAFGVRVGTGTASSAVVSTVQRGIVNNATGVISATSPGSGYGIQVNASTFSAGITNAGTITGSGSTGFGVGVSVKTSSFTGGITNSGTITGAGHSSAVGVDLEGLGSGSIDGSLGGLIANSGEIIANGMGIGIGVADLMPITSGGISNSGTILGFAGSGISDGVLIARFPFGIGTTMPTVFTGGFVNSGQITSAGQLSAGLQIGSRSGSIALPTFQGGVINTSAGMIAAEAEFVGTGLRVSASTFSGGVSNAGMIGGFGQFGSGAGVIVSATTFVGGITNSGTISGSGGFGVGVSVLGSSFAGGITNSGAITGSGNAFFGRSEGVQIGMTTNPVAVFQDGIVNTSKGVITATGVLTGIGLQVNAVVFVGGISNAGIISGFGTGGGAIASGIGVSVVALSFAGGITNNGLISGSGVTAGIGILLRPAGTGGSIGGPISNSGMITAASGPLAVGIWDQAPTLGSGVFNSGTVSAIASGTSGVARSIDIGPNPLGAGQPSVFSGGINNSGLLTATGKSATGVFVSGISIGGGINNTGSIIAATAINLTNEGAGNSNTITQAAGLIEGAVKLSANADQFILTGGVLNGAVTAMASNSAVVLVPSGTPTLAPTASISGVSRFTQTGGTLVFQLTSSIAAGTYPTVSAAAINLNGTLLAALQVSAPNLAASLLYKDVFVSSTPAANNETVITDASVLFQAKLIPDALTANGLDLGISLSPAGEAVTAQVLAQSLRFGLVGQQVIIDTLENRLQVGENHGPGLEFASLPGDRLAFSDASGQQAQTPAGGTGTGGQVWGRVYGTVGHADATANLSAFSDIRIGGIVGADWHFDEFALGIGFNYANTDAPFADGSKTTVNGYQGLVYGGWRQGPAYVTALVSGGANDYSISRNMMQFGLTGFSTSDPAGVLVTAFGETGYGVTMGKALLTPYVNIGYVHQSVDAFSETGSFGAFNVAPADGSSLSTTIGLRASTRIDLGSHGTLVPEVRAGWQHEFLDQSQTLTAQLAGTAASPFTVVGPRFGRESALVGIGVSHEFEPGASFFLDYDGRFTGGFNQNSASAGIKVKF